MKRLANEEISSFCMELAIFIHAGIAPSEGLYLLAEESEGEEKERYLEMAREMESGSFLSDVMKKTGLFPTYVTGLTAMGEQSGCLENSLQALASYYEQRSIQDKQIRNALLYPSLLLTLLLAVIAVLLVRVLPVFQKVYASLGGQFTGVAGGLLALGKGLGKAMPFLLILLALIVGFIVAFAVRDGFRGRILLFWQKHHGDKGISKKMTEVHLAQAIAMGLHSGLHMEETLKLAEELQAENPQAASRCRACREYLEQGINLAEAMNETKLLPKGACHLLAMGLHSGTGDQVMEEIVRRLTREAEDMLENRIGKIEPAIVLTASAVVGAILLSVMLPLMNIMSAIG